MHDRILQAIYHSFTMIYIYNGDTCNNYMIRFMINYMRDTNKMSFEGVENLKRREFFLHTCTVNILFH